MRVSLQPRRWLLSALGALVAAGLLFPAPAWAWNIAGHLIMAQIAYEHLGEHARRQTDALLARPIEPFSITGRSREFAKAALWADEVRHVEAFKDTAALHFVDHPLSFDDTPLPPDLPQAQNILVALDHNTRVLRASDDLDAQAQALRFLMHFVGDVHQPLHCATRVTRSLPAGDQGGNLFWILPHEGKKARKKLHAYWDEGAGAFPPNGPGYALPDPDAVLTATARIAADFPDTDPRIYRGGPDNFAAWANESAELARTAAYPGIASGEEPSSPYENTARRIAEQRVAWAAYRLAALLNAIWP